MAAASLKQVSFYRNSNLQMLLVRTHFIHLVINVLAMASGLLPSLHSVTIPLPLLFCHPPAIRPCHSNVGSFENISFFQCFGLGSALSWHFRQWFDPRSQHLVSRQRFTTQTIKFLFHGSYITNERYVKENIYIWHDRCLTYWRCFPILFQVPWNTHKKALAKTHKCQEGSKHCKDIQRIQRCSVSLRLCGWMVLTILLCGAV